ncbi:MAG: response regulator [Syntrophobacteraceae bacterium]|nr:response regulator [Desulfobacteraceae bacterium]
MLDSSVPETVLIVDDEPSLCELIASILRAEGFEPVIFTNPADAVEALERRTFSLAFIDINMPAITGLELASHIKKANPHCEIVIVTGFASIDNAVQAIKLGASDYIRKPFSTADIVFCLKQIQDRKALSERARRAEERYFRLVQNSPMLIFRLHDSLDLDFVNQASLSILGYTPQEAMLTSGWLLERINPEDRPKVESLLRRAFQSKCFSFTMECRFTHKDEHVVHGILKCIPCAESDAETEGEYIEGIIVDISDRVLLEKTLLQREKLNTLGIIAAEVAHEIRNPLVCIGGFARRLLNRFPEAAETRIILRESERLEKMLGRIRTYLTPVEFSRREFSINEVLVECVELLALHAKAHGVTFRMELNENLPTVFLDPDIIAQVGINLIRNALSSMKKAGEVVIRTYETEQNIHIDFSNEVHGTKLKRPELLFMPFDEGGESIGLPLCYQLLENMGGLLSFTQENTQVVFTVSVPKGSRTDLERDQ